MKARLPAFEGRRSSRRPNEGNTENYTWPWPIAGGTGNDVRILAHPIMAGISCRCFEALPPKAPVEPLYLLPVHP